MSTNRLRTWLPAWLLVAGMTIPSPPLEAQEPPRAGDVHGAFSREDVPVGDPETGYVCMEFSPDMNFMAWVEPKGRGRNTENTVWLCAMDAETADLVPRSGKGFKVGAVKMGDYEPSGQPQWGQDDKGVFAVILDPQGRLVVARPRPQPDGGISATVTCLPTPPNPSRMFPYPTRLTKPGGFVVYIQYDSDGNRQLHFIDLADPTREHQITRGPHLKIGRKRLEPFIVDIPRWFYDVETRADGLPVVIYGDDTQPNPQIPFPVIEVKELDFAKPGPTPATVARPLPVLFDPFPFLYRGQRYMIAGVNAKASGVVVKPGADGQYRDVIRRFEPRGSGLENPHNLASAEPFVWRDQVYSAFQVNEPGAPGTTSAEIWLTSVLDGSVLRRISDDTLSQRADPEFFIGRSRAWIFYFAHSGDSGRWQLRRADTGLR